MKEFPFSLFFLALSQDGIPVTVDDYERVTRVLSTSGQWNRDELRGALLALLAHDPQQSEIFKRRFDSFFAPDLPEADSYTPEQIDNVLAELREFNWDELNSLPPELPLIPTPPPLPSSPETLRQKFLLRLPTRENFRTALVNLWNLAQRKFSVWYAVIALLITAIALCFYFIIPPPPISGDNPSPSPLPSPETSDAGMRSIPLEQAAPEIIRVSNHEPQSRPLEEHTWSDVVGSVGLVALPLGLWLLLALLSAQLMSETPPQLDTKKPRLFPLEQIGGEPLPRLDDPTLDHLADSLSYFLSDNPGKRLDVKATVRAIGQNAGLPVLYFHRLRRVRNIYILEDAHAEPLAWNPIAGELAEGLKKRGINIHYGRFHGNLEKFQMQEGGAEWLEDIDARRQDSIILFFSDGKRLNSRRDAFLLEALARNSSIAWLDLREKKFWDESAELIKNHKIPLYEATAGGVTRALKRFLTERGSELDDATDIKRWQGAPASGGLSLDIYVESLLGDALAWAQACAMIQPLTNGMADALRRRFQPDLSPERVERLFRLPNSAWSVSGLRFSLPTLAVLRRGFTVRWSEQEQKEILGFILDQIRATEPLDENGQPEKNSLRHLAWEWTLERVRLELEPDKALQRLAQLKLTPLGNHIKAEFANLLVPGQPDFKNAIPLRIRPVTQRGLNQFEELSERSPGRNGVLESLRAARHIIIGTYDFAWRIIRWGFAQLGEFLRETAGIGLTNPAPSAIVVEPAELRFARLRTGESDTQILTLSRADGEGLNGRIVSNVGWLQIQRTLCDGQHARHTTCVTAIADGLKPGKHSAVVTFVTSDNSEPLEIEATAHVVRSWSDALVNWWRENKPSRALRVALLSLLVSLTALTVAEYALPRNWLNSLYNSAPELIAIESNLQDAQTARLTAYAKDANGSSDNINYNWNLDWEEFYSDKQTAILNNLDTNQLPRAVRVKLYLTDGQGGHSIYETTVELNKEKSTQTQPQIDSTKELLSQNKTSDKEQEKPQQSPVTQQPETTADWLALGQKQFAQGKIDEAIISYTECIKLNPLHPVCYFVRGLLYMEKHNYDQAITDFIKDIESDPESAALSYNWLGVIYSRKGDNEKAIRYFNIAIQLDPKMPAEYYQNRANAYCGLGKFDLAKADEDKVTELDEKVRLPCRDGIRMDGIQMLTPIRTPTPIPTPTPVFVQIKVIRHDNPTGGLTGREIIVHIRVTIEANGKMTDIDVVGDESERSGEAKKRVRTKWKFTPATENDKPVKSETIVKVIFS